MTAGDAAEEFPPPKTGDLLHSQELIEYRELVETTNTLAKLTSNPSATENLINVNNLHSSVNVEK
jgi:hypothetical protein